MQIGDKVKVIRTATSFYNKVFWWPESGMTGNVEAMHKNGSVRVACDQLRNKSDDGRVSKTFKKTEATYEIVQK